MTRPTVPSRASPPPSRDADDDDREHDLHGIGVEPGGDPRPGEGTTQHRDHERAHDPPGDRLASLKARHARGVLEEDGHPVRAVGKQWVPEDLHEDRQGDRRPATGHRVDEARHQAAEDQQDRVDDLELHGAATVAAVG
jgi:hypothetical protein